VTNGKDAAVKPVGAADAGPETAATAIAVFRVPELGASAERRRRERLGDIPGVFALTLDVPAHTLRTAHGLQDRGPIVTTLVALGLPPDPVGGERHPAARAGLVASATEAAASECPAPQRASSTGRWAGWLVAAMSRLAARIGRRVR
jgi:hypothetical protein